MEIEIHITPEMSYRAVAEICPDLPDGFVITQAPEWYTEPADPLWVVTDRVSGLNVGLGISRDDVIDQTKARLISKAAAIGADIPTLLAFCRAEATHGVGLE